VEVSGRLNIPADLVPGKQPSVPIKQEARLAQEPVWTLWTTKKTLASIRNETPVAQPLARRYTNRMFVVVVVVIIIIIIIIIILALQLLTQHINICCYNNHH
jgi:t-SNARE complex subunit (syntaxin)